MAVSADNRWAYITNYGATAVFRANAGRQAEPPGNTITVLDVRARKVKATYDLGDYQRPHGIVISRDGTLLWVTCEGAQAVIEIEAMTGRIVRAWRTNQEVSHMLVASRDEQKLYVTNIGSGSVTVIDRSVSHVDQAVTSRATGAGAEGIALSPDGREVWVTNRSANTLSVIATATDQVVATLASGGTLPIRTQFTPDGRQVWVSNGRSNSVTLFDATTRQPLKTVAVGAMPVGLQITPDGQRIFIALSNDNRVVVLTAATGEQLTTFTTGNEPDGMAWVR